MKRGKPIARKTRVKPTNATRRATAFVRAYGSKERVEFVQALPCYVCGAIPSENAHTETGGMGRKADAHTVIPLCPTHHRRLHANGIRYFETWYGITLAHAAAITDARYEQYVAAHHKPQPPR